MTLKSVAALKQTGREFLKEFERGKGAAIEQSIIDTAQRNILEVAEKAEEAGQISGRAFDVSEGILERSERAITGGAGRDPRRAAASKRKLGLRRALADVTARNLNVRGQRQEIRGAQAAAAGLRGTLDRQVLESQQAIAQDETQRNIEFEKAKQAAAKKKAAGIGAIAGLAANFIPGVGPLVAPIVKSVVTSAAA